MDEITLVNLLDRICEKNGTICWKITCKYSDGAKNAIMEVQIFDKETKIKKGSLIFDQLTGKIIRGEYQDMNRFKKRTQLIDSLLEILYFELERKSMVSN